MSIYIALAIPFFFVLIGVEVLVSWHRGVRVYRFADAIACLSNGIGQQLSNLLYRAATFALYVGLYQLAPLQWDQSSWVTWLVGLCLVDHQYYWWHRTTHRSKLFWTTHVVHHQSEDYNLAVALRQSWTSGLSTIWFDLPLALLGLPPLVYALSGVVNLLYQFPIHTELVERLGPLEWVLNTPSHHRVHHGVDPRYVDRNYAGIFIIWDRLFGTFCEEDRRPVYGTVKPLRSYNPIWANLSPFLELARDTRSVQGGMGKLRYVLSPPEWRPPELGGPVAIEEPEPGRLTWNPRSEPEIHAWITVQFAVWGLALIGLLASADALGTTERLAAFALGLWTTTNWSGLLEERTWAMPSELVRLLAVPLILAAASDLGLGTTWPLVGVVYSALSLASLRLASQDVTGQATAGA